ncbi:MAG: A/G-specific adenine glycosylase [Sphingobacteriales bacterium]|nr:A/G-specific adenine glycosylase [Sphingobacteriales bacterium]
MNSNPSSSLKKAFTKGLLEWNAGENSRVMPWKGEKDPYRIWISEIILQQTRVEQGLDYYNRFIKTFPNIRKLAAAPDEKVFKCWEGLGYYSRCRNLLTTARYITKEKAGHFPDTYKAILSLKGIGPYTAAAISSFAFQLPHAVVDGNVYRVLSRYFGIDTPTDSTAGKKMFNRLAEDLLDPGQPGLYNQAIMDFGAVVCKPAAPLCASCLFRKKCVAFRGGRVSELPLKSKKIRIRVRWLNFIIPVYNDRLALRRRSGNDIWQGLFEFPMIETNKKISPEKLLEAIAAKKWVDKKNKIACREPRYFRQQLSHQLVQGMFVELQLSEQPVGEPDWQWVKKKQLGKFSFPGLIRQYLAHEKALSPRQR